MSIISKTERKVFIIESLDFKDEDMNLFEGHIISNILQLSNIESKYYYVRTKKEFEKVTELFNNSNYRYLHISCHGGENSIWTTLDKISFEQLGVILKDSLNRKRLFLSACSVVNNELAKQIIPKTGCISIIGPQKNIEFRDATIMWASFYHLMFKEDSIGMSRSGIKENLQIVVTTFEQPFNYFSSSRRNVLKKLIMNSKS